MCTRHLLYGRPMKLLDDWRQILRRAWSARFAALAAVFSVAEAAMPFILPEFPPRMAASIAGLMAVLSLVSRVVAQPKMHNESAKTQQQ